LARQSFSQEWYCHTTRPEAGKMKTLRKFLINESGATAVEYAIMALGIALVIVMVVDQTGTNMNDGVFTDITTLF
jgi:pilus assembly protein Flp/PilA